MSLLRTVPAIFAAGMTLAACSDDGPTTIEIPLAQVEITAGCSAIGEGESCPMQARGITADGEILTNAILRWSSSATEIVQVNAEGRVFGISPGKATIIVEAALGEGSDSAEVFVFPRTKF
ncbi:MAG TPA: Ig-like domain-containing protein [Gemmatimonadota bacterium]|nr:Ig-like domain-containing protein [Gemmatimonadota bacterium]